MDLRLKEAMEILVPLVDKYRNNKNVEIEFRLGFWDIIGNKFNNSVGQQFLDKISKTLNCGQLECIQDNSDDYFNSNGSRMTKGMRKSKDYKKYIKKKNFKKIDFCIPESPFTVRVSVAEEIPIKENEFQKSIKKSDITYTRNKKRKSFLYKYWSYDITVTKNSSDLEDKYEVELEIVDLFKIPSNVSSEYLIHSSLLKMIDLINMCEKIDDNYILLVKKN